MKPIFLRRWGALVTALALLAGCAKHPPAAPAGPPGPAAPAVLRLSQRNEPATLDPQLATLPDEFIVIRALTEGLVSPAPDGLPRPRSGVMAGVAESWETSREGTTWIFHLRGGAKWSNGDPVTAGDFVFTIRRALNPALAAPKAPLFFGLRNAAAFYRGEITDPTAIGAAAPTDQVLVLTLEHPLPQLLSLVASGPWLPVHAATVMKFGDTRESAWSRPGNYVGNGPFVLSEWRPHEEITVTKNPHFRAAGNVRLDAIRFQIFDNENTEERAFRAGQVDVTMTVPVSKLDSPQPPVLRRQALAETRVLVFNVRRPALADVRVRQALSLALDRAQLVNAVLRGGQVPTTTIVPPGLGPYRSAGAVNAPPNAVPGSLPNSAPGPATDDLTEARRLLAAAGFPGGRGLPKLHLSSWTSNPVLEAIQQMWHQGLGVETEIEVRDARVHVAALRSGDYDIGFLPVIPDYGDPLAVFDTFVSSSPDNYAHWSNPRYDALVDEAGRTLDAGRRLQLEQKAEELLLADLPAAPLYFNVQNYRVAPRVAGWREDPLWTRFYLELSLQP